jgi:hypothetical protein
MERRLTIARSIEGPLIVKKEELQPIIKAIEPQPIVTPLQFKVKPPKGISMDTPTTEFEDNQTINGNISLRSSKANTMNDYGSVSSRHVISALTTSGDVETENEDSVDYDQSIEYIELNQSGDMLNRSNQEINYIETASMENSNGNDYGNEIGQKYQSENGSVVQNVDEFHSNYSQSNASKDKSINSYNSVDNVEDKYNADSSSLQRNESVNSHQFSKSSRSILNSKSNKSFNNSTRSLRSLRFQEETGGENHDSDAFNNNELENGARRDEERNESEYKDISGSIKNSGSLINASRGSLLNQSKQSISKDVSKSMTRSLSQSKRSDSLGPRQAEEVHASLPLLKSIESVIRDKPLEERLSVPGVTPIEDLKIIMEREQSQPPQTGQRTIDDPTRLSLYKEHDEYNAVIEQMRILKETNCPSFKSKLRQVYQIDTERGKNAISTFEKLSKGLFEIKKVPTKTSRTIIRDRESEKGGKRLRLPHINSKPLMMIPDMK